MHLYEFVPTNSEFFGAWYFLFLLLKHFLSRRFCLFVLVGDFPWGWGTEVEQQEVKCEVLELDAPPLPQCLCLLCRG